MIILLWFFYHDEQVEYDDNHILRTWQSCHMTNVDDGIIMIEFST
jgi:hypothetical protein